MVFYKTTREKEKSPHSQNQYIHFFRMKLIYTSMAKKEMKPAMHLAHPFSKFNMSCLNFIIISCLCQTLTSKQIIYSDDNVHAYICLKPQEPMWTKCSETINSNYPNYYPTLVITRSDKSMRFIKRSEMVFLTNWTAAGTSLSISILWRHSFTRFLTNKQLSLRTVSMPVDKLGVI